MSVFQTRVKTEEIVPMESTTTTVLAEKDLQIKTVQQVCFMIPRTILFCQIIDKMCSFLSFSLRACILLQYIHFGYLSYQCFFSCLDFSALYDCAVQH